MSSKNNGFFIKCPKTGKNLSVSRDVYHALQYAQQDVTKQQTDISSSLKKTGQALTQKYYTGSTKDMEIAVKFNERGQVDEFADPQIELKGVLDQLPADVKEQVQSGIYQFLMCANQALGTKSSDMERELKAKLQTAA